MLSIPYRPDPPLSKNKTKAQRLQTIQQQQQQPSLHLWDLPWFDPGLSRFGFFISNLKEFKGQLRIDAGQHDQNKMAVVERCIRLSFTSLILLDMQMVKTNDRVFKTRDQMDVVKLF